MIKRKLRKTDIDLIDRYLTGEITARQFETTIAKLAKTKPPNLQTVYLEKMRRIAAETIVIHLQRNLLRYRVPRLEKKVRPYTVKTRPR